MTETEMITNLKQTIGRMEAEAEMKKQAIEATQNSRLELAFKIQSLQRENQELRAELAAIKPSWDDAPEWAECLIANWIWAKLWEKPYENLESFKFPIEAMRYEESRPEPVE